MINLDNLVVGAIQAGINGVVMYWAVKFATRLEKIKKSDKKDDKKEDR